MGVRWHLDGEGKAAIRELPSRSERPVHRDVLRMNAGKSAARLWLDKNMLVARALRINLNSRHHSVHPVTDHTVGVVIERIHGFVLKRAVRFNSVPPLPDRGGALCDRVQP